MTPEGRIKKQLKALLARYTPRYEYWPVPGGFGAQTVDCLLLYRGEFFAIECKRPGAKATPLQQQCMQQVVAARGRSFLVDGPDALERLQRALDAVPEVRNE